MRPGTLAHLSRLRKDRIEPLVASHHGRIFKLMGDGILAEFASVVDAVTCAPPPGRPPMAGEDLCFRIAVNLGDVIIEDGDIYGNGVNIALAAGSTGRPRRRLPLGQRSWRGEAQA